MNTQASRILNHLQQGKTIDRLSALVDLGVFELSARIIDLQNAGHSVNKKRKQIINRFGEKASVVEYSLGNKANG
jgi:23S rRNA-/tRNA-specific pseudouridylate synthase